MTRLAAFPPDEVLSDHVAAVAGGRRITALERRPLGYATSFPIDHVTVRFDDGSEAHMAVKDLRWSSLIGDAAGTKPPQLHAPARSIGIHVLVLAPANLGPRVWAAGSGTPPDGEWIAVELVDGMPLWEIGDIAVWEAVARWLAEFHTQHRDHVDDVRRAIPELIEFSTAWMRPWLARARTALEHGSDPRRHDAMTLLDECSTAGLPRANGATLVHGEFYPSNVMVAADGRICPVDWELAGIGDPMIDLAALVAGWDDDTAERLVHAYSDRIGVPADDPLLRRSLSQWRLMNAARWLGWAPGWRPPDAHAHDWIGEILSAAEAGGTSRG